MCGAFRKLEGDRYRKVSRQPRLWIALDFQEEKERGLEGIFLVCLTEGSRIGKRTEISK